MSVCALTVKYPRTMAGKIFALACFQIVHTVAALIRSIKQTVTPLMSVGSSDESDKHIEPIDRVGSASQTRFHDGQASFDGRAYPQAY